MNNFFLTDESAAKFILPAFKLKGFDLNTVIPTLFPTLTGLFFIFFIIMSSCNVFGGTNSDDYFDLVSYAVNSKVANHDIAQWARRKLINDSRAVPYLIESLDTKNSRTIYEVKGIIQDIGKPAVPVLTEYLSDTFTTQNVMCIYILGEIGDSAPAERLLKLLDSKYTSVKIMTAQAMGGIKYKKSIDKLIKLTNDTSSIVRKAAIVSLGQIAGDTKSINCLINNFNDTYYFVRYSAIEGLENFDTEMIVSFILNTFKKNNDIFFRNECLKILNYFNFNPGSDEDYKYFENFLDYNNEVLTSEIIRILSKTTFFSKPANLEKIKNIDTTDKPLLNTTIRDILKKFETIKM